MALALPDLCRRRDSLSHEARNLASLGGSTLPGTTGYNPTETIEATAWYAADDIAQNFNKIAV